MVLYLIVLYCIILNCFVLHCIALHCIVLHGIVFNSVVLHNTELLCVAIDNWQVLRIISKQLNNRRLIKLSGKTKESIK